MLIPNPSDLPALFEAPEVEEEMQEMPKKKRRNADRLSNFSNNTTTIQPWFHDSNGTTWKDFIFTPEFAMLKSLQFFHLFIVRAGVKSWHEPECLTDFTVCEGDGLFQPSFFWLTFRFY